MEDIEKRNKRKNAWDKVNTKMMTVKLNNKTDFDIIEYLSKREIPFASYVKELIRKEIAMEQYYSGNKNSGD